MKKILCLDFDGVIHSYSSGWKGATEIPDPPVPGAMKFLCRAVRHFKVCIFSSRSNQRGGRKAMKKYLKKSLYGYFRGLGHSEWVSNDLAGAVVNSIEFPKKKPAVHVTIDDRAMTFNGEWPSILEISQFKPWNNQSI